MGYAILETGGKQYRAEKNGILEIERLDGKPGGKLKFERVLLSREGDKVLIGAPYIDGACVEAEVLDHRQGKKLIAYKHIRREGGAQTKTGHRQILTRVKVTKIKAG